MIDKRNWAMYLHSSHVANTTTSNIPPILTMDVMLWMKVAFNQNQTGQRYFNVDIILKIAQIVQMAHKMKVQN